MFSSHLLTHFKQKEIVPDSTLDNFYDIESISRQNEKYSDFSKLKTFTQPLIQAILEKNISDLNKALAQPIKKTLIDGIVISGLQADSYFLEELLKQKIEVLTEVNASNKTLAETALSLTLTILLYRQDLLTYNKVIDTFFHSDIRISTEETLAIYKTATKNEKKIVDIREVHYRLRDKECLYKEYIFVSK